MKKLVYSLTAAGLLIAAGCNEPAKFDQAACENRADSIATARVSTESATIYSEYDEICGRQLAVLESARDSLQNILASAKSGGRKTTKPKGGSTTTTGTNNDAPNTGKKGTDEPGNTGKKGGDQPVNTGKKK